MSPHPIPLTVIGGYLGAGKTALVNHLLSAGAAQSTTVLVNDFGALDIDARLIADRGADTISLANGCICCAVGDQLVSTLMRIGRQETPPANLVIETSGIADPRRVAQIGTAGKRFRLTGLIVVVDASDIRHRSHDPRVGELIMRQLAAADLLVVNKCDLVDTPALEDARSWLAEQAPEAGQICTQDGRVPAEVVLSDQAPTQPPEGALGDADPEPSHGLMTRLVDVPRRLSSDALRDLVEGLPGEVVRAKGLVTPDDQAGEIWRIDRVGPRVHMQRVSAEIADEDLNRLVLIGSTEALTEMPARFGMDRASKTAS